MGCQKRCRVLLPACLLQCSDSSLVVCRSDACRYLGREHVKSTRSSILYQGLQDRNVVAQGFPTGCGCRHDNIPASQNGVDGLCLVGEHLGNVSCSDGGLHWIGQGGGGQRILGLPGRNVFHVDNLQGIRVLVLRTICSDLNIYI